MSIPLITDHKRALTTPVSFLLGQLQHLLKQLTPDEYVQPVELLTGSSIGQHSRHVLEFYIELEKGYRCGVVNYDKRERDHRIETDLNFALEVIQTIIFSVEKSDKAILLEAAYHEDGTQTKVETNYFRELIYNLEHTVHHMAHIRIGVNLVSNIPVPEGFGVALSTLKHRQQTCAR